MRRRSACASSACAVIRNGKVAVGSTKSSGAAISIGCWEVADVIVLAAPWTADTDQILDAAAIAKMKRTAIVINVARGQLVDEPLWRLH